MLARISNFLFAREEAPAPAPAEASVPVQVKQLSDLCNDLEHAVDRMDAHAVSTILNEIDTLYKLEEESFSIDDFKHWAGEIASIKAKYETALLTAKITEAISFAGISPSEGRRLSNSTKKYWIIPEGCDTPEKIRQYIASKGGCAIECISLVCGTNVRTDNDLLSRSENCQVVIEVPAKVPAKLT